MNEPFVLRSGLGSRWVLHAPLDPYGDGYVLMLSTELYGDGLAAATVVELDGIFVNPKAVRLPDFLTGLAADWRGWEGVRYWTSSQRQLVLEATHDGTSHVSLGVTLRTADADPAVAPWSATVLFVIEASREMARLALRLSEFLDAGR
ncbi:DUF6228 family protein [Micromonospora citrea]|uniref:DUF6228 family protein n=1 Tax=Micromonospora citrea TaxID=47855 RepID=UPI003C5B035C